MAPDPDNGTTLSPDPLAPLAIGIVEDAANSDEDNGTTVDSRVRPENELRVPSHGRGLIWDRPPAHAYTAERQQPISPTAAIRDMMREGLKRLLPELIDDIASGKVSRIQGLDLLAKYGIGANGTVTIVSPDVIARLERQAMLIASRPEWRSQDLLLALRDVWT